MRMVDIKFKDRKDHTWEIADNFRLKYYQENRTVIFYDKLNRKHIINIDEIKEIIIDDSI